MDAVRYTSRFAIRDHPSNLDNEGRHTLTTVQHLVSCKQTDDTKIQHEMLYFVCMQAISKWYKNFLLFDPFSLM
jgi:hypothetical protein